MGKTDDERNVQYRCFLIKKERKKDKNTHKKTQKDSALEKNLKKIFVFNLLKYNNLQFSLKIFLLFFLFIYFFSVTLQKQLVKNNKK